MSIKILDTKRLQEVSKEADDFWNPGYGDDHIKNCKGVHEVHRYMLGPNIHWTSNYGTGERYRTNGLLVIIGGILISLVGLCVIMCRNQVNTKEAIAEVPLKIATADNLRGLADKVTDYENTKVVILPWQTRGRRQVTPGTGIQAGVKSGEFLYLWQDGVCLAKNNAVGDMYVMVTGRLPSNASSTKRSHVLVREANYHPDGSQLFWPVNGDAFVVLLAPPGDDVTPEDFQAFYCDGSFGLHIHPKVWHQPLYPIGDRAIYISKQSATYACVGFDAVDEFGKFLKIPLIPELAQ